MVSIASGGDPITDLGGDECRDTAVWDKYSILFIQIQRAHPVRSSVGFVESKSENNASDAPIASQENPPEIDA